MATFIYDLARNAMITPGTVANTGAGGPIDFLTSTISATLVNSNYVPVSSTDQYYSAITATAIAAPSAVALTGKTCSAGIFNCTSIVFTAVTSGFIANAVVIYRNTGTAGTSNLIAYIDSTGGTSGLPVTSNGSNITVNPGLIPSTAITGLFKV